MKKTLFIKIQIIVFLIGLIGIAVQSLAVNKMNSLADDMQHGFILGTDDRFASHLVGTGPHSRQVEIVDQLLIDDLQEMNNYQERKLKSASKSYFLFQAQNLNLPTLSDGDVLIGHIVVIQAQSPVIGSVRISSQ